MTDKYIKTATFLIKSGKTKGMISCQIRENIFKLFQKFTIFLLF